MHGVKRLSAPVQRATQVQGLTGEHTPILSDLTSSDGGELVKGQGEVLMEVPLVMVPPQGLRRHVDLVEAVTVRELCNGGQKLGPEGHDGVHVRVGGEVLHLLGVTGVSDLVRARAVGGVEPPGLDHLPDACDTFRGNFVLQVSGTLWALYWGCRNYSADTPIICVICVTNISNSAFDLGILG